MAYLHCIARLAEAAGRQLKDEEIAALFERVHKAALEINAGRVKLEDVGLGKKLGEQIGVGMSKDALIQAAAKRAAQELAADAAKQQQQIYLQVLKIGGLTSTYKALRAANVPPLKAAEMLVFREYRGKASVESMEQHVEGVKSLLMSKLLPTWDALGKDFFGLFQDEAKQIELLKALHGEKTKEPMAERGAKAYLETAEYARQWFNSGGGDIGHLENWSHPQHHSQNKAARASEIVYGKATDDPAINREAWIDRKMGRVDRSKYVDDLGAPMSEAQIREFLGKAWETVSTNGLTDRKPGEQAGIGKLANRHAEHRSIHFKDAESTIADWREFGDKSVVEILHGHLDRMARDIAVTEFMGPNDLTTWNTIRDTALNEAVLADRRNAPKYEREAAKLDRWYDYATGRVKGSANRTLSGIADGIAHLNTAAKGGGFFLASLFGDRAVYQAVAHLNNLPKVQDWLTQASLLNPANAADRRVLQRNGLMLESLRSGLNRFWDDFGHTGSFAGTTGKFANATMRMTGMTAINAIPKGAFELGLGAAIGEELKAGKGFAGLAQSDVRTLRNYGITETDWRTWQLAGLEDMGHGNKNVLLADNIAHITDEALKRAEIIGQADGAREADAARRNATVKLLGAVNTEADFAIVTPGMKERAQFYSGMQRGTVSGEIGRAVLQFKAFPWAQFQRMMDLVANVDGPWSKAAMAAYLVTSTTLAGAMILQTREMLTGKDPRNMAGENWHKFWGAAFLQGGALGIYGDFLYSANQTRYGSGPLEVLAGPTLGPLAELGLTQPLHAAKARSEGKETHLAAQSFADLKGFVPFSNLWYAKAALDHLVWQQAMDALSPGYLWSMRSKSMKEYGQDWWWQPGELKPDRGPDLSRAFDRGAK